MRSEAERPAQAPLTGQVSDAVRLIQSVGIAVPDRVLVHDYLTQHADMLDITVRVANLLAGDFQSESTHPCHSERSDESLTSGYCLG